MRYRRYAVGLVLMTALLGSGCQKSLVFHVANATDQPYGVDVRLDGKGWYSVGMIAPQQRIRKTVEVAQASLPIRGTLQAGDLSRSFTVPDYENLDQIDLYFLIDAGEIVGPRRVPFGLGADSHTEGHVVTGDGDSSIRSGPEVEPFDPPADPETEKVSRLTAKQKQKVVYDACVNLAKLSLVAKETIELDGEQEDSSVVADAIKTRLVELGFSVPASTATLSLQPGTREVRQFAEKTGHSLAVLVTADSSKDDTFADAHRYEAKVKGVVLNLRTGRTIATRTFTAKGKRLADKTKAGESAAKKASASLAAYLTDEVCRKWEEATLVRVSLRIRDVNTAGKVQQIRNELQSKRGVYYASVESWDASSQVAEIELLVRLSEKDAVPSWVEALRKDGVDIKHLGQQGEAIDAWRKVGK